MRKSRKPGQARHPTTLAQCVLADVFRLSSPSADAPKRKGRQLADSRLSASFFIGRQSEAANQGTRCSTTPDRRHLSPLLAPSTTAGAGDQSLMGFLCPSKGTSPVRSRLSQLRNARQAWCVCICSQILQFVLGCSFSRVSPSLLQMRPYITVDDHAQ